MKLTQFVFRAAAVAGCILSTAVFTLSASAGVILPPGGFAAAVPGPDPGAGTLLGTLTSPFADGVMSGSVVSSVWAGDPFNPHGGLTFTYEFSLAASSTQAASEFTVGSFDSFLTDVSFNPGAYVGGVAPSFFSRSTEGGASGQVMRFGFFGPSVGPGRQPRCLW